MIINLKENEYDILMYDIIGTGGFQSLQKRLKEKVSTSMSIELSETDIEQICRYVNEYGSGGAQNQFREIFGNYLECLQA